MTKRKRTPENELKRRKRLELAFVAFPAFLLIYGFIVLMVEFFSSMLGWLPTQSVDEQMIAIGVMLLIPAIMLLSILFVYNSHRMSELEEMIEGEENNHE